MKRPNAMRLQPVTGELLRPDEFGVPLLANVVYDVEGDFAFDLIASIPNYYYSLSIASLNQPLTLASHSLQPELPLMHHLVPSMAMNSLHYPNFPSMNHYLMTAWKMEKKFGFMKLFFKINKKRQ